MKNILSLTSGKVDSKKKGFSILKTKLESVLSL